MTRVKRVAASVVLLILAGIVLGLISTHVSRVLELQTTERSGVVREGEESHAHVRTVVQTVSTNEGH